MARTNPMFARFDPSAFPTASPLDLLMAALAETSISGADVPIDTTVKPINNGESPKCPAIDTAPSTNRSAAQTRAAIPTIRSGITMNKEIFFPVKAYSDLIGGMV